MKTTHSNLKTPQKKPSSLGSIDNISNRDMPAQASPPFAPTASSPQTDSNPTSPGAEMSSGEVALNGKAALQPPNSNEDTVQAQAALPFSPASSSVPDKNPLAGGGNEQVFQAKEAKGSSGGAHTGRNQYNQFPVGTLTPADGSANPTFQYIEGQNTFVDAAGREWTLLSDDQNVYHQPDDVVNGFWDNLGQKITDRWNGTERDPFPNKKFISRDEEGGGSFEAILQPDEGGGYSNNWLNHGSKQGSYNYVSPEGIFGNIGHFALDVVPHFFSDNYEPTPESGPVEGGATEQTPHQ